MSFSISIRGNSIPYQVEQVPDDKLAYYTNNPRIASAVEKEGSHSQVSIEGLLQRREHVKELRKRIDEDGKVNEPLVIVPREHLGHSLEGYDYVVLEGNSRLAAVRIRKPSEISPPRILDCHILDLSNYDNDQRKEIIFSFLCDQHILGKHKWESMEQAALIYRRIVEDGMRESAVAKQSGLSPATVKRKKTAYELMIMAEDEVASHFAYYDAYASTTLDEARRNNEWLDGVMLDLIKNEKFKSAAFMRDNIGKIMSNLKARKHFKNNPTEDGFQAAIDIVSSTGGNDQYIRTVKKFRRFLIDNREELKQAVVSGERKRSGLNYELDKVRLYAGQILGRKNDK